MKGTALTTLITVGSDWDVVGMFLLVVGFIPFLGSALLILDALQSDSLDRHRKQPAIPGESGEPLTLSPKPDLHQGDQTHEKTAHPHYLRPGDDRRLGANPSAHGPA